MRQILYYYYNIYFEVINAEEENCSLLYKGCLYIFKKIDIDLELLNNIVGYLNNYNFKHHDIVLNNRGGVVSTYKNCDYVLMKVNDDLKYWYDFCFMEIDYKVVDIGELWEKKLDYYIDYVHKNNVDDLVFLSIFNYYAGMCENAIAIANRVKNNGVSLKRVICHRRVEYPFNYIKYYDPTEMIIDYRVRDFSEYLKDRSINNNIDFDDVSKYIIKMNYSNDEANILLARLLYPSFFFDKVELLVDNIDISCWLKLIDKYERFLYEFCCFMEHNYNIYRIDWIKKVEFK